MGATPGPLEQRVEDNGRLAPEVADDIKAKAQALGLLCGQHAIRAGRRRAQYIRLDAD